MLSFPPFLSNLYLPKVSHTVPSIQHLSSPFYLTNSFSPSALLGGGLQLPLEGPDSSHTLPPSPWLQDTQCDPKHSVCIYRVLTLCRFPPRHWECSGELSRQSPPQRVPYPSTGASVGWSDLQMVINRGLNKKEGLRASPHCRVGLALKPSRGTVPGSKRGGQDRDVRRK